jgi:uncharacterized protein YegP (UPF0339 family)
MSGTKRPRSSKKFVFDVYQTTDGEWRWRLWSRNGRIVADSGEGYKRRQDAVRMCERLQDYSAHSSVFVNGEQLT